MPSGVIGETWEVHSRTAGGQHKKRGLGPSQSSRIASRREGQDREPDPITPFLEKYIGGPERCQFWWGPRGTRNLCESMRRKQGAPSVPTSRTGRKYGAR